MTKLISTLGPCTLKHFNTYKITITNMCIFLPFKFLSFVFLFLIPMFTLTLNVILYCTHSSTQHSLKEICSIGLKWVEIWSRCPERKHLLHSYIQVFPLLFFYLSGGKKVFFHVHFHLQKASIYVRYYLLPDSRPFVLYRRNHSEANGVEVTTFTQRQNCFLDQPILLKVLMSSTVATQA